MEKKSSYFLSPKSRTGKFLCKTPILFAIPLSDYSDEMEKQRDKEWYIKIQKLEKKSKLLREELQALSKNNFERILVTRQRIAETYAVKDKFLKKRSSANSFCN